MKKQFIGAAIIAAMIWSSCNENKMSNVDDLMVPPTDDTFVKENMEEGNERKAREAWIELMHQSAPGTNWREIEQERSWSRHLAQKNHPGLQSRTPDRITVANGRLTGEWVEKGSDNLSGSVVATAFDAEADEILIVSAGGSLFRGALDGSTWRVVNQDLRFGGQLLNFIGDRLVGVVNRVPAYSDDQGVTWTPSANWITYTDTYANVFHPVVSGQSRHIIALSKPSYWSNLVVLVSEDSGESFEQIMTLGSHDPNKYALKAEQNSDRVILVDKVNDENIDFYTYDPSNKELILESVSRDLGFGPNRRANLACTRINDSTSWYYIYGPDNIIYHSDDLGANWESRDTIGEGPWGVGMFVSPSDPELLLAGAVHCYRSLDGGRTVQQVNRWQEYYGSVAWKLHADMMFFNEFQTNDGRTFLTISNHGGLNLSWDKTATTPSISLKGLNVSQYYSVRTDPFYRDYIYAGSQDQGFQRGVDMTGGEVSFDQIISGDYGHIVFSAGGSNMWSVYPGGWIIYYDRPREQRGPLLSYTIDSEDETVWIPPLAELPFSSDDAVLAAGGSIHGGPGSHLIHISRSLNNLVTQQYDFDFKAASSGGTISAIHPSNTNKNVIFVATTNGNFFKSEDAGLSWTKAINKVPGGHYLYGSSMVSSYTNEQVIYAGGSGYSTSPVVISTDGGRIFRSFREGMPATTVFQLALDPEERYLFAATEDGPYVCLLDENVWYPIAEGIAPNQTYWTVEYLYPEEVVRFGTYGRGIWDFEIESLNTTVKETADLLTNWTIFPNPVAESFQIRLPDASSICDKVVLSTVNGQVVKQWSSVTDGMQLNVSDLNAGNYLVGISSHGQMDWKKIVIK